MHTKRLPQWVFLLPLLLIGFGLRIYHIDNQSFWTDEYATWDFVRFWPNPIMLEARMWVYLGFVSPWAILINTEIGLRWSSVLAGILSLALVYDIGRQLGRHRAGLIAALLLMISPLHIYYSQEARSFALVVMWALMMLWSALLAERGRRWASWVYAVSAMLTTGLHMVAIVWVLTLNTFLIARKWQTRRGPSGYALIFVPVGTPIMIYAIRIVGMAGFFGWGEGLGWIPIVSPFGALSEFTAGALSLGWPMTQHGINLIWIPILWIGWRVLSRINLRSGAWRQGWAYLLLMTLVVMPPMIVFMVTYVLQPLFALRYLQPSLVSMLLLIGLAFSTIRPLRLQGAAVALVMLISLLQFDTLYLRRPDWRGLMTYAAQKMESNDIAVICPGWHIGTAEYYFPDKLDKVLTFEAAMAESYRLDGMLDQHEAVYLIDAGCTSENMEAARLSGFEHARVDEFEHLSLYIYRK